MRANLRSLVSGSRASTASDSDRFDRNGNGCPGSTASGVTTGNTDRRKYLRACRLVSASSVSQSRMWMPRAASPGKSSSAKSRVAVSSCVRTIWPMRVSWSRALSPSGLASTSAAASSCSCSPETRIMKNSSRFDE